MSDKSLREKLYLAIKSHKFTTGREFARAHGVAAQSVQYHLKRLQAEKLIGQQSQYFAVPGAHFTK